MADPDMDPGWWDPDNREDNCLGIHANNVSVRLTDVSSLTVNLEIYYFKRPNANYFANAAKKKWEAHTQTQNSTKNA